jgi:hypothetical protein
MDPGPVSFLDRISLKIGQMASALLDRSEQSLGLDKVH